jgi:hypothetical protein
MEFCNQFVILDPDPGIRLGHRLDCLDDQDDDRGPGGVEAPIRRMPKLNDLADMFRPFRGPRPRASLAAAPDPPGEVDFVRPRLRRQHLEGVAGMWRFTAATST